MLLSLSFQILKSLSKLPFALPSRSRKGRGKKKNQKGLTIILILIQELVFVLVIGSPYRLLHLLVCFRFYIQCKKLKGTNGLCWYLM